MIINQLRGKCEKLIEIDNYLQVKMQMLARLFQKNGIKISFIDSILIGALKDDEEVSLEDM